MRRTSIACLTPPGAGAIATLAVRGPEAWTVTRSLFRGRLPDAPTAGKFYLGRFGEGTDACDEVVLAVKAEWLELHCHGGVEVVRFLQELFVARGARAGSGEEVTCIGNSGLHRLAQQQLVLAPTVKTAAILLDQFHCAFEKTVATIVACLQSRDYVTTARLLSRLAQTQRLTRHLVYPFRVAFAGAPNVGKSSLVNAVAGYTRSVVSPTPGTTRDVVTTPIALDGWPVELIDTAGLHESTDALEKEGMVRARAALGQADLRLWVLEASAAPLWPPREISVNGMIINKVDLPTVWKGEPATLMAVSDHQRGLLSCKYVSCKTRQGVTELCQWIGALLGLGEVLASGEGVAFTPELSEQVLAAHEAARGENWPRTREIVEGILNVGPVSNRPMF